MKIYLNDSEISKLKPKEKRYDVRFYDPIAKNLLIRVGTNGSKTWCFYKKIPNSTKRFQETLGCIKLDPMGRMKHDEILRALAWAAEKRAIVAESRTHVQAKEASNQPKTMEQLFEKFMTDHSSVRNSVGTVKNNESMWKVHLEPSFKGRLISEISKPDIVGFINRKANHLQQSGKTGGRVNNLLSLLKKMFNFAIDSDWLSKNPCTGVEKLKTVYEVPFINEEERAEIRIAAAKHGKMFSLIVEIALMTGMRKQEILAARWENYSEGTWVIPANIAKDKKEHKLNLPESLVEIIETWRVRDMIIDEYGGLKTCERKFGYIFPSNAVKYGGRFCKKSDRRVNVTPELDRPPLADIKSAWKKIRRETGFEKPTFHSLRRDFATGSAKAGVDVYRLQKAMRHKDIKTTMRYINEANIDGSRSVFDERERVLNG